MLVLGISYSNRGSTSTRMEILVLGVSYSNICSTSPRTEILILGLSCYNRCITSPRTEILFLGLSCNNRCITSPRTGTLVLGLSCPHPCCEGRGWGREILIFLLMVVSDRGDGTVGEEIHAWSVFYLGSIQPQNSHHLLHQYIETKKKHSPLVSSLPNVSVWVCMCASVHPSPPFCPNCLICCHHPNYYCTVLYSTALY